MLKAFFLFLMFACGVSKLYSIFYLYMQRVSQRQNWIGLIGLIALALFGSAIGDCAWVIKYFRMLCAPTLPYSWLVFWIRIAHALLIIQYQALALVPGVLTCKQLILSWKQKVCLAITGPMAAYFVYLAVFSNNLLSEAARHSANHAVRGFWSIPLEAKLIRFTAVGILPFLVFICIMALVEARNKEVPEVLRKQIDILARYFYFPFMGIECLYASTIIFQLSETVQLLLIAVSSAVLTIMVARFLKNIFKVRFLDSSEHIAPRRRLNFVKDHADIVRQVAQAENHDTLRVLTKQFCKSIFPVTMSQVHVHIRAADGGNQEGHEEVLAQLLKESGKEGLHLLEDVGMINEPDLEFELFYNESRLKQRVLGFLKELNASVFVPLFCADELVGFVMIMCPVSKDMLVDKTQRDEMILFASYVQTALARIELEEKRAEHEQEKQVLNALRLEHKKFTHVRWAVQRRLDPKPSRDIALIVHRSGALVPINQAAQNLMPSSMRLHAGIPLVAACKQVAESVEKYKTAKRVLVSHGTQDLSVSGSPSIEHTGTMITVTSVGLLELLHAHPSLMAGRDDWEYLLFLGSGRASVLLEQFLPGATHRLLEIKIALIRASFQSSIVWVSAHNDDKDAVIDLVHTIAEGGDLFRYAIAEGHTSEQFVADFFGVNSLTEEEQGHMGLLYRLDRMGTLVLENVDLLPFDAQEALSSFIATGEYQRKYGHRRYTADVPIIVTTKGCSISDMVRVGTLSKKLAEQLHVLPFPYISELAEEDLTVLANKLVSRLAPDALAPYVSLTTLELRSLVKDRAESLLGLRKQIKAILKKREMDPVAGPTLQTDELLGQEQMLESALRLGKKALENQGIMAALWKKYKNQNRIAQVLGVNRSSVSRRCKEYGLIPSTVQIASK